MKQYYTKDTKKFEQGHFEILAKTLFGLEDVLADEVSKLGGENLKRENRAIRFVGNKEVMYRVNYHARTALRVLKPIASFHAQNEDQLYHNTLKTDWSKIFSFNQTFAVDSVVFSPKFKNSHYVALKIKDAIVDQFRDKLGKRPSVDSRNPQIQINAHISNDLCTLSLDSSGSSLHKRGYRKSHGIASLNEVLAAGMILLSGWDGSTDFYDPMCGSGTLVIEAAMIAYGIPPGTYRRKFLFENWKDFEQEVFEKVKNEKTARKKHFPEIIGLDNLATQIRIARNNLENAELSEKVKLKILSLNEVKPGLQAGTIIMNPPYGERMKSYDLNNLYKEIGNSLKQNFTGFDAWVLSGSPNALKNIGLRPSRKIALLNGDIKCQYQKYELYKGSKKTKENWNKN